MKEQQARRLHNEIHRIVFERIFTKEKVFCLKFASKSLTLRNLLVTFPQARIFQRETTDGGRDPAPWRLLLRKYF
jgi:hypothetical protein